jgi:hypothetical protein
MVATQLSTASAQNPSPETVRTADGNRTRDQLWVKTRVASQRTPQQDGVFGNPESPKLGPLIPCTLPELGTPTSLVTGLALAGLG